MMNDYAVIYKPLSTIAGDTALALPKWIAFSAKCSYVKTDFQTDMLLISAA